MNKIKRIICAVIALALVMSCSLTTFAQDVVKDAKSKWVLGDEYGGAVGWNDDGSFTVYGKSGIATYTASKFFDEEITVRFKASIALDSAWAAIYLRNNIDADLLLSKDDGGGVRAFPWYGKGQPFSINIKNNGVSLSQCYADELQPSGLGIGTPKGQYNPADGKEHTITFKCYEISDTQTTITVKYDGVQAFDYTYTHEDTHEPKKEAGYLSFACYESGDWLQILSVEVPDGSVELTEDTVSSSTSSGTETQTPNTNTQVPNTNTQTNTGTTNNNGIDYSQEYERTTSSSGTVRHSRSKADLTVLWYALTAIGGMMVGSLGTFFITKQSNKKKETE